MWGPEQNTRISRTNCFLFFFIFFFIFVISERLQKKTLFKNPLVNRDKEIKAVTLH